MKDLPRFLVTEITSKAVIVVILSTRKKITHKHLHFLMLNMCVRIIKKDKMKLLDTSSISQAKSKKHVTTKNSGFSVSQKSSQKV